MGNFSGGTINPGQLGQTQMGYAGQACVINGKVGQLTSNFKRLQEARDELAALVSNLEVKLLPVLAHSPEGLMNASNCKPSSPEDILSPHADSMREIAKSLEHSNSVLKEIMGRLEL